jgi:hypothetical protein
MISRKSALAIAEAYNTKFVYRTSKNGRISTTYHGDKLYDFLYENEFDAYLLNALHSIPSYSSRGLKDYILQLHTGESIVSHTKDFTWEHRQLLGQRILKDLAECLINLSKTDEDFGIGTSGKVKIDAVNQMQRMLELDGYIYRDNELWVPEESVIEEKEEQGILQGLMNKLHLLDIPTLTHHLELSATDYSESHWDNSIANSRKFLEGILAQAAKHYSSTMGNNLSPDNLARPAEVRNYLEKAGLLEKKEKDTIAHVYGLLSETGGHPYIADQDQARLMRHLALTFSQFVLLRLEGALGRKV